MSDFLDDISAGMDELNELAGESFVIANATVIGDFTGADSSVTLDITGGGQENLHGTLIVSRRRCPDKPVLLSLVTDAAGTSYRIGLLAFDAASWTLTLTHPNARRRG